MKALMALPETWTTSTWISSAVRKPLSSPSSQAYLSVASIGFGDTLVVTVTSMMQLTEWKTFTAEPMSALFSMIRGMILLASSSHLALTGT